MRSKLLTGVCLLATLTAASAQTFSDPANLRGERVRPSDGRELPIDRGTLGLEQMLRRINTRASLMLIVAHPDDEDGGMLTYVSRGLGARTAMLTLTRGEGGQNAMTGDFEDALGLLRTQELLSADRYLGVDQMFGTEVDFGFSKTKAEAFRKWTHERVLYDAVRAVRLYRPLVIAAVFVGGVTDGHGQHQVSGEIAQEVFKAAGDPKVFPELTKEGILPWQPLKVYARVPMWAISSKGLFDYATGQYVPAEFTNYVTGQVSKTPPSVSVTVPEGQRDPLLTYDAASANDLHSVPEDPHASMSYVQFARIGLGLQRSQVGPGVRVPPAGAYDVGYHRYGSVLDAAHQKQQESSFFDGIDMSITGIADLAAHPPAELSSRLEHMAADVQQASTALHAHYMEAVAPALADALQTNRTLLSILASSTALTAEERANLHHELAVKQVQLNDALALALGLQMDASTQQELLPAGRAVKITTQVRTSSTTPLDVAQVYAATNANLRTEDRDSRKIERSIAADHANQRTLTLAANATLTATQPYFYRSSLEEPVYSLRDAALRDAPATPAALVAWATVQYRGLPVLVGSVVRSGQQPVRFVPDWSVALDAAAQVVPSGQQSLSVTAHVVSELDPPTHGMLALTAHPARPVTPKAMPLQPGDHIFQMPLETNQAPLTVGATATLDNHDQITQGFRAVGYGDLPRTDYFTPATDRIVPVDLQLPKHLRIGYLPGTGDAVPAALRSIGLQPTMLTMADLTPQKLAGFDTVILGVRTYNAHPDLHGAPTQALLDFARQGGNVIVQYQTTEFTTADAPYPLSLGSNEKVVDETAPVVLLKPSSPLLTTPNRIRPTDFDGWIEERGHGFMESWDPQYAALTETHDPGEPSEHILPQAPQRGGLLTAQVGKGRWTYVAYALYRQLPEAVPGAYRLFVNLLAPAAR
jgi:LmbE family N-acetylglucosaminyl deacetylase